MYIILYYVNIQNIFEQSVSKYACMHEILDAHKHMTLCVILMLMFDISMSTYTTSMCMLPYTIGIGILSLFKRYDM